MKRGITAAVIVLAVLALGGIVLFARTLRYGFSAHDEPLAIEAFIARTVRQWAVPSDLRDVKNPVALTPEVLAEAREHWADHCATCHGNDGKGQTAFGSAMYPKAPDMTREATQSLTDGELFSIIENGIRLTGMPGFGDGTAESAHGSWSLVHFIRHLPQITEAELAEMAYLNPISRSELREQQASEAFLERGEEPSATAPRHHQSRSLE